MSCHFSKELRSGGNSAGKQEKDGCPVILLTAQAGGAAWSDAQEHLPENLSEDPLEVLIRAVDNMKPRVEVKSRRVGGATYQVPVEVSRDRQLALAIRWMISSSKGRRGIPMQRAVAMELMDAYNNQGSVIKKKDDTHRMAQANKAFAHYAW